MARSRTSAPSILIASDSPADAELVQSLLEDEFGEVALSVDPDTAAEDFRVHRPGVLLLVFRELQRAEDHYLGLFRLGSDEPPPRHRAIILCDREHVPRAYQLCRRGLFDDYVLFWPSTHDATRLRMSIHLAAKSLRADPSASTLMAGCATEVARLQTLDSRLTEQQARGDRFLASAADAVAEVERDIGQALAAPAVDGGSAAAALSGLQRITASLRPLEEWAAGMVETANACRDSLRTLGEAVAGDRPQVLVVEDDEFQCRLIARILEAGSWELQFAPCATEALSLLSRARPDLIITDYRMPEMSGVEFVRRLKAEPGLATIPVIMLTGSNQRDVVVNSIEAGVTDFIVKPFDRETLVSKVTRLLHQHEDAA